MKRLTLVFAVAWVVASAGWMAGCRSPEGPALDDDLYSRSQAPNPDDPYGGYNLGDEAPAFGDPALLGEFAANTDAAYDDPMANDPGVRLMERADRSHLYLMITWGNLKRDSTISFVTDWSGSLSIDPGAILLRRVISFERGDRILPRTRRDLLEWESKTQGGIDGIVVRIIPRPSDVDSTIDSTNTVIEFTAGGHSESFTLAELPGLHKIVPVDNAGNAIAFNALRVDPNACPHGFLRGVWRKNPERPGGVFYGMWAGEYGLHKGFVRGFYGVTKEGKRVVFGKWIDPAGRFVGIFRGEWGLSGDQDGGWFAGVWLDRDLRVRGRAKGEWRTSAHCHGGFFRGVWERICN